MRPLHGRKSCGSTLLSLPLFKLHSAGIPGHKCEGERVRELVLPRPQEADGSPTFQALKEALATLPNAKDVLVWREGFSAWKKAADCSGAELPSLSSSGWRAQEKGKRQGADEHEQHEQHQDVHEGGAGAEKEPSLLLVDQGDATDEH